MAMRNLNSLWKGVFVFVTFLTVTSAEAAIVKGRVTDAEHHEALIGASVYIDQDNQINDISGLDGSYTLRDVKPGDYSIVASYTGYETFRSDLHIENVNDVVTLDISLNFASYKLEQVEVVGASDVESELHARSIEKTSDYEVNVISSRSIDLLPDITAAGVLQRVSGVTMQKTSNSGEAQYAIIRGMDKRYNYTLVNGIKIPSPNNKNRYVPMDIFPSELLARIEVAKTLTPDMEGDAIGGAMNLVLKDAPDKVMIKANYSIGYNQLLLDRSFYKFERSGVNLKSPSEVHGKDYLATPADFPVSNLKFTGGRPIPNMTGGLSIGNRFGKDKRLGVIFSSSYQSTYGGANTIFFSPNSQPSEGTLPNQGNKPTFDNIQNRTYSTHQNRLGLHTKFDYTLNQGQKLTFYAAYFQLDKFLSRHSEGPVINGSGVGNYISTDRSRSQLERIFNATFHGEQHLNRLLDVDWSAAYSRAWAFSPDEAQLEINSTNIDQPILQSQPRIWQHNTDQDLSGYLNLTSVVHVHQNVLEFKAGAMYRHKNRDNYYNDYDLSPALINGQPQVFTTIEDAQWEFRPVEQGYGSQVNQNDYHVTENVMGYYADVKAIHRENFSILVGVRIENTDLSYTTPMPESFVGREGSQSYTDVLPGVHLKYNLNDKQSLRLSYFGSIARPGFFEVTPYLIAGEYFDEMGNPYLRRTKANNIDLRYEYFPTSTSQVLAGVFYKAITDPIEYSFVRAGSSKLNLQPQNFGDATNYGFEFVLIKYIKVFGISVNYTYTKSQITTNKQDYHLDDNHNIVSEQVSQTRPLQGQADHIANVSAMYKNPKIGLDMQLSGVYTGHLITQVSPYYGLDYWAYPITTIDFSFEKKISKKFNFSVYGKAKNLLNAKAVTRIKRENTYYDGTFKLPEQDDPHTIVVQKEEYKPSYLLGLRYSF